MTNYLEHKLNQIFHKNKQTEYARPLTSIKERDLQVLNSLFANIDGEELEADINKHLQKITPEPPWEGKNYSFLKDFI
ncbi:MAG: hypothetical protein AAF378_17645 [Cyanobacteria bacterium P01_A01_bin.84]